MKKYIFLIVLSLLLPLNSAYSADAPCGKSQLNKTKGNLVCVQITKYRYAWVQSKAKINSIPVSIPTPTPITTPATIAYTPPSVASDDIEICKIKEVSNRRGYTWAGFPNIEPLTQKTGTVKWALIPVDFADLPGEKDFRSRVDEQMKLLSEWFESTSNGKFKVEWVVADNWVRLPGVSSDYPVGKVTGVNNTTGGIKLFKTAMATADPTFNFSNIQTVNFILPMKQNIANEGEQGFPWDQHVKDYVTNEGRISSFSIAGKYQTKDNKSLWNYWVHEFGHAIGLPHVGGNGPGRSPYSDWTIMADQDGSTRELGGWLKFLSRWMPDEDVYCKESNKINNIELTLVPISSNNPGIKLVILPLSTSKALLIESRRVTKYSCTTSRPRDGVLVSILDLSLGHGQDFLTPIAVSNKVIDEKVTCNNTWYYFTPNPLLIEGDKIFAEGLTINVMKHNDFDKIIITK